MTRSHAHSSGDASSGDSSSQGSKADQRPQRPVCILVVDAEPTVRRILEHCPLDGPVKVHFADSVVQARAKLSSEPVDLMLLASDLTDTKTVKLVHDLKSRRPGTQTLLLAKHPSAELTVRAMRVGVSDVLTKPLRTQELAERLREAVLRCRSQKQTEHRLRKMKRLCKKLQQSRQEITHQVDTLCADLVTAYQELATQMQAAIQTSEFHALVRSELDLEQFTRKLLEYILEKVGATNAAIYLPSGSDEFTLGGYINYDLAAGAPDILLQQIADQLVPHVHDCDTTQHWTTHAQLQQAFDPIPAGLEGSHVIATACRGNQEVLAVLVLFRVSEQPFSAEVVEAISAVAPMIGEHLARIIRVHHRHLPDPPADEQSGGEYRRAA